MNTVKFYLRIESLDELHFLLLVYLSSTFKLQVSVNFMFKLTVTNSNNVVVVL